MPMQANLLWFQGLNFGAFKYVSSAIQLGGELTQIKTRGFYLGLT